MLVFTYFMTCMTVIKQEIQSIYKGQVWFSYVIFLRMVKIKFLSQVHLQKNVYAVHMHNCAFVRQIPISCNISACLSTTFKHKSLLCGYAIFINKIAHLVVLVVMKYIFLSVFSLCYRKYRIIMVSNMFPKLLTLLYLPLKSKQERNHVSNLVTV